MTQYRVAYRRILWTFVEVEADDYNEAIEKGYDELGGICAHCSNAWENKGRPTQELDDDARPSTVTNTETTTNEYEESAARWNWGGLGI